MLLLLLSLLFAYHITIRGQSPDSPVCNFYENEQTGVWKLEVEKPQKTGDDSEFTGLTDKVIKKASTGTKDKVIEEASDILAKQDVLVVNGYYFNTLTKFSFTYSLEQKTIKQIFEEAFSERDINRMKYDGLDAKIPIPNHSDKTLDVLRHLKGNIPNHSDKTHDVLRDVNDQEGDETNNLFINQQDGPRRVKNEQFK
eukprot:NODE_131_length_16689_cov_0.437914.p9 type:complete len:198 gc:universal NODE_131_length_16689_cov_0.437914:7875-8468(+)